MNEGLEAFKSEDKVKQICGCNLLEFVDENTDAMFLPVSSSWGWGTWQRVWKQIDFNELLLIQKFLTFNINSAQLCIDSNCFIEVDYIKLVII